MSQPDDIFRRIGILRPRAKFISIMHSSEFIDEGANLGDGFHYVSLYDEKIDSNVISSRHGLIMIHNTYLSSFSYNLLLCWLLCSGQVDEKNNDLNLTRLLKHNFKKYFAEQLLYHYNNVFSRAIFLETLLYEQVWMIPVFEAKSRDSNLSRNADLGAQLMSSALSFHELGHFYLNKTPQLWDEMLEHHSEVLSALYSQVAQRYPAQFVEEFKCDTISVVSCLDQYKSEMDQAFCLRAVVVAFAAFAVMYSLTKSAAKTATDHKAVPDKIDFNSIEKRQVNYDYTIDRDLDFIERAKLVIQLSRNIAQKEGMNLFDGSGTFPLPETILNDLLRYVDLVMENEDQNARAMSLLVAESLHGYPEGLEYLKLRSKTFAFGSGRNPDGSLRTE